MTSSFPDVDLWLAIVSPDHIHHVSATKWWESNTSESIGFCRFTQMSLLRLLTTAAVMNGKPLTNQQAWAIYDRLFEDDRVTVFPDSISVDTWFRTYSATEQASPKVWADSYLAALAAVSNAILVTFDKGLRAYGTRCLVLS